ncbi:MAG TPA: nitroreductase family deazaflavin-dependent oxidoreductase [Nakamurella sp.]|jgi:deazaflavin-dependent oxidoreductase (nitroreductase family)
MSLTSYPPTGIKRWFFRAPVWVYRARLGFLFGNRMLYLVTRGRRTGQPREAVLEATRHNSLAGLVIVISGWGDRADWFRNLQAGRAVEIRIGGRRIPSPQHRLLDTDQIALVLEQYARDRPWSWRSFAKSMGLSPTPTRPQLDEAASRLRAVAFGLPTRSTPRWHYPD